MSGEPKPSQGRHQPLQTLAKFLPSKQPVVGSNPTGGVKQNQSRATEGVFRLPSDGGWSVHQPAEPFRPSNR